MDHHSVLQGLHPVVLGGRPLRVYTHSYLHYGIHEVDHRIVAKILSAYLSQVDATSVFEHPCYPKNYTVTPDFNDVEHFPIQVNLTGTADYDACVALVRGLFDKNTPCYLEPCTFNGVYQPTLKGRSFVAFANFAETQKALGLHSNATLAEFRIAVQAACVKGDVTRPELCLWGSYVHEFFSYALGFGDQIEFRTDSVLGDELDWTTGAILYEVNVNRSPPPRREATLLV